MDKTTKSKVADRPAKASEAGEAPVKSRKTALGNYTPSEEEIRAKAREIYHQRLMRGEYGTELEDWKNAENLLKSQGR